MDSNFKNHIMDSGNRQCPSWFKETELSRLQSCACRVLKAGHIPKHVAFIMDGNRRYARKQGLPSVLEGHAKGFEQLSAALKWCRDFGIEHVTVYAFSLDNFKRKQEEVDGLMNLARTKFQELLKERESLEREQVRFSFFGNLERLPIDIQRLIAEIELLTEQYNKANVNVCLAYTSQDEMTRASRVLLKGVEQQLIQPDDITDELLSACLDSADCADPDLLVRTSGEQRLSDFLLWQTSYSCLYFEEVLWPEFNFWHLCYAIMYYQWHYAKIHQCVTEHKEQKQQPIMNERVLNFVASLKQEKHTRRLELTRELQ